MNSRTLVLLLAALAVLVALAVAVSVSQRPATVADGAFLPDLKPRLNDIDKVVVRAGGNRTVATLERREGRWVLAERDAYPADVGRIRGLLIALAEARMLEEKTSNPELYARLQLDDVEKETAAGVRLDLAAGEAVTSVIVGATNVGGGDRAYARRAGEPTGWLVSGAIDAPRETADWLDRGVVDLDPGRVHAVTIVHPGGPTLRVVKAAPDAEGFTVENVPAGRELSFPSAGNSVGAGLADLTLESVEPAARFAPGDVKPVVATFETFDGLVVEASTWALPAGPRTRFTARVDETLAARFPSPAPAPAPAPAEAKAGDDAAPAAAAPPRKSIDDLKVEAADLEARLGGWVYGLPDFKVGELVKKPDELLAPKGAPRQ